MCLMFFSLHPFFNFQSTPQSPQTPQPNQPTTCPLHIISHHHNIYPAAEDLSITRIAGLTWDQWNARLAMPLLQQFHDGGGGPSVGHSLMFPTDLSIVSAAMAAKSNIGIGKNPVPGQRAIVVDPSQPSSSTASESGDHQNQPKAIHKLENSPGKQLHHHLQFSGDLSADNGTSLDGFACPECGRMYKLKSSLRNHLKWECGKDPQFQCPFCVYRAKQKMHIGRHMERMHKEKFIKIDGDQIVECRADGRAIDLAAGSSNASPSTDAVVVSEAVTAAAAMMAIMDGKFGMNNLNMSVP